LFHDDKIYENSIVITTDINYIEEAKKIIPYIFKKKLNYNLETEYEIINNIEKLKSEIPTLNCASWTWIYFVKILIIIRILWIKRIQKLKR
jgi:hypothetical protein